MPDWKTKDSSDRLLAALIASLPNGTKLDNRLIATHFGQNATYDAIEGRLRGTKKEAAKMKSDYENGSAPMVPARGTSSVQSTPRKPRTPKSERGQNGVLNGRVTKASVSTPSRKRGQVKTEMYDTSTSVSTPSSSTVSISASSNDHYVLDDSFFSAMSVADPAMSGFDLGQMNNDGSQHHDQDDMLMGGAFWDDEEAV